jgi:hypothetical protein
MKTSLQKLVPALIIAIALSGTFLVGGYAFRTTAAQPQVYGLYDANDVYLGDVLSIQYGGDHRGDYQVSYTTFLPSINKILQLSGYEKVEFLSPKEVMYDGANCQGNAYVSTNESFRKPWLIRVGGVMYKVASTPQSFSYASRSDGEGICIADPNPEPEGYRLTAVSMPFDISAVEFPFKVKLN